MARGWESKSVEDQQAEASARSDRTRRRLTPDEIRREREERGLNLARTRIVEQLKTASHPTHRRMLEQALADLDEKLARLC